MTLKDIFQNFCNKYLNRDFSLHNESNETKSIRQVLSILLEGSMSQNFDFGLGYFVMLRTNFETRFPRKESFEHIHNILNVNYKQ